MRIQRFCGRVFLFLSGLVVGLFTATFSIKYDKPCHFTYHSAQSVTPWNGSQDPLKNSASRSHIPYNGTNQMNRSGRLDAAILPDSSIMKIDIGRPGDRLAICVRIKNEAPNINEWIAFHLAVGVSKIVVLDDNSTDGLRELLSPYVSCGVVEYVSFIIEDGAGPGRPMSASLDKQMVPLKDCVKKLKKCPDAGIRWVALTDADEYLFPALPGESLVTALSKHVVSTCVTVGRYQFGSNGHIQRPKGLILENFLQRAKLAQKYPKMILNLNPFNGSMMRRITNMHLPPGAGQGNTGPTACYGWPRKEEEFLRINHYLRSVEDFNTKLKSHFTGSAKYEFSIDFFLDRDANDVKDMHAIRYTDHVRDILNLLKTHEEISSKRARRKDTIDSYRGMGNGSSKSSWCPLESWLRARTTDEEPIQEEPVLCYR